ncbi:tetratricopeptide repeat protein [Ornithinibacillus bavariensis]|uniref:tetratricopeptide repeat protein n=1 Tax=Ornithinibacillus bavariensis TaxID=545502 RepID=UPI000EC5EAED|nr:tetratricopeptide repeat-containing protein [Ornithinibacillus sp.]
MQQNDENIILFPRWQNTLKNESLQAIQERRYEDALDKINRLLHYHVKDHEIIIGKIMCLMELGRFEEAEEVCEEVLINRQDENYYQYLHIYLTILFQTNKYSLLLERIEEEMKSPELPLVMREQFEQLYELSIKLESDIVEKNSDMYRNELKQAVIDCDYFKQWRTISKLRSMKFAIHDTIIELLSNQDVHPVVKTNIFHWLQDQEYSDSVQIVKFGIEMKVIPIEISEITIQPVYIKTLQYLSDLEQENPTLFLFLEKTLYRYFYVKHPILPPMEDCIFLAKSLQKISNQITHRLEVEEDTNIEKVLHFMEDIVQCEQLYLSIIED